MIITLPRVMISSHRVMINPLGAQMLNRLHHRYLASRASGVRARQRARDFGSGVDAEPGEDLTHVVFDGLDRDVQIARYLLIRLPGGDRPGHGELAGGQRRSVCDRCVRSQFSVAK